MQETLLLAGNDPAFVKSRAEILRGAGYNVLVAETRRQAMQMLATRWVDLAILDVRLEDDTDPNDESGIEIALDRDLRAIPKVVMTRYEISHKNIRKLLEQRQKGARTVTVGKSEGPEVVRQVIQDVLESDEFLLTEKAVGSVAESRGG